MARTNMYGPWESDLIARPSYADTVLPKFFFKKKKKIGGGSMINGFYSFLSPS